MNELSEIRSCFGHGWACVGHNYQTSNNCNQKCKNIDRERIDRVSSSRCQFATWVDQSFTMVKMFGIELLEQTAI
jgi:hypothetical protein